MAPWLCQHSVILQLKHRYTHAQPLIFPIFWKNFPTIKVKKKKTIINFPEKSNTLFTCHSLPIGIAGLKYQIYKSEIK